MWGEGIARTQSINSAINTTLHSYADYGSESVTPLGAIQLMPAWGGLAHDINDIRVNGLQSVTEKRANFFNLGSNLVILDGKQAPGYNPAQVPRTGSNVLSALKNTGVAKESVFGGMKFGGPLAAAGTVLEYSITSEKQFASPQFAIDISSDTLKGVTSGAVGGVATTAVVGAATVLGFTIGAPVIVAGAAAGFAAGYLYGEHGYDAVADPLKDQIKSWFE
ncbi:hypothetical protein PSECIP111951_04164 [Pseudoalteromonas holothuriae]|uniref:Uncharacterized protein n=1 Tax=Pseudoalteromonas holothuriae TaxID=2963714 RepID=A0ABN8UWM6_9GAMM|nr:hypothetical protein [Pseudoalteromonas sp. CIP111951]CAH9068485.1 hypothetical protein PSECIP111951_04164 [Pseudoalteromonas sp. CIP111951]